MKQHLEIIDQAEHLFLADLHLDEEGKLRILLTIGRPINPDIRNQKYPQYELVFDLPICHFVRDETYGKIQKDDEFKGKYYREYSKSSFLDYASATMDIELAKSVQPLHEVKHFGIMALDSILDVISVGAPEIRKAEIE